METTKLSYTKLAYILVCNTNLPQGLSNDIFFSLRP